MGVLFGKQLVVTQRRERVVQFLDPADGRVRLVGRRGEGPGEFQHVTRIGLIGDTLWIADAVLGRTTLFSEEGKVISTQNVQALLDTATRRGVLTRNRLLPGGPLKGGSVLLLSAIRGDLGPQGRRDDRMEAYVLSADRRQLSLVATILEGDATVELSAQGPRPVLAPNPFGQPERFSLAPGGTRLFVARLSNGGDVSKRSVNLSVLDSDGNLLYGKSHELATRAILPQERAASVSRFRASLRYPPDLQHMADTRTKEFERKLAAHVRHPALLGMLACSGNSVWLHTAGTGGSDEWLILNERAVAVARVRVPRLADRRLLACDDRSAWFEETLSEADDTRRLVRYTIARSPRGPRVDSR